MIKKTWIITQEAAESFGWMFLDGLMLSRVSPYRHPAKGSVHFRNHPFTMEERWKEKKSLRHLRVSHRYTKILR